MAGSTGSAIGGTPFQSGRGWEGQLMPRRRRISSISANSSSAPAPAPAFALPLPLLEGRGRVRVPASSARPDPAEAEAPAGRPAPARARDLLAGARRRSAPETTNSTAARPASATPAQTFGENTNPSDQCDTAVPSFHSSPAIPVR